MTRYATYILAFLAVALLAGCRSAPEPTERSNEVANRAQENARLGAEFSAVGDLQRAQLYLDRALSGFRSIDDRRGAARVLVELARVYGQSGLLEEAEAYLDDAADAAEQLDMASLQIEVMAQHAELALHRNDPDGALQHLQAAEASIETVSSRPERRQLHAVILHNRGVALARQGAHDEARRALSHAVQLNEEREALSELASNHYMLASVESRSGNTTPALEHARAALEIDKTTENSSRIALDLEALAAIHRKVGDFELADDYLARAYGVYEALAAQDGARRVIETRLELAEQLGDAEAAQELRSRLVELDEEGDSGSSAP